MGGAVLEVGAGAGTTADAILPVLPGGRLESVDIVSGFFGHRPCADHLPAQASAAQLLDIQRTPAKPGVCRWRIFDVVIASNVLHATRDLRQALSPVFRGLLAPGGLLLLMEHAPQRWLDLTFGLTGGWWLRSRSPD